MRHFSEEDVRRLLPVKDAIEVLRRAFADFAEGRASHQPRRRLTLDTGAVLHSLTGAWGGYFGTKVYSTHPKHGAWFTVLLYDARTARPLASFDANWLGQIRTGAVSGLATDLLVGPGEMTVGCIGSGFQARGQLEAIAAVRPIRQVRVWSRTAAKRDSFASEMTEALNTEVIVADSAEATARGANILVTATWAKDPVIVDAAVEPGTLVLAMGSNNPQRRELPGELVRRSVVIVEDREACRIEAGDLLLAFSEDDWGRVEELKNLVRGADPDGTPLRMPQDRPRVFKSVGIGLSDVAVAGLILERATPERSSADPSHATR